MHEQFDLLMDKHEQPYFETEEKDKYLNIALLEYVKTRYKHFEVIEKRREDLRPLISHVSGTGISISFATITDMLFVISLRATYDVTECGITSSKESVVKPVQHDDYYKIVNDPFNKPTNTSPAYLDYSNYIQIYPSGVTGWTLVYLKYPTTIDGKNNPTVSSDMPPYTHHEIVELAVRKAMVGTENPSYQAQVNEINVME
jgi:hypothetical protein